MNLRIRDWLAILVLAAAATGLSQAAGRVHVEDAWIRAAPPGSKVLAGYLTIVNPEDRTVRITGISSPGFGSAELHLSQIDNGVARMLAVDELQVTAGATLKLEPGGYHLMLFDPAREYHDGDSVTLYLHLDDEQCLQTTATIRREAGTPP